MTSREKFEAFLVSEYEWGNDALNAANFHGDDATGYYTGGDFIYDGQSCSECLFWAWRGWQAAELASEQKLTDMAVQLANAESNCAELAAEISRRDAIFAPVYPDENTMNRMTDVFHDTAKIHCDEDGIFVDNAELVITAIINHYIKSDDAFLAEVRAQGVDAAIDHLNKIFDAKENVGEPIRALEYLVQVIRKGAAL